MKVAELQVTCKHLDKQLLSLKTQHWGALPYNLNYYLPSSFAIVQHVNNSISSKGGQFLLEGSFMMFTDSCLLQVVGYSVVYQNNYSLRCC